MHASIASASAAARRRRASTRWRTATACARWQISLARRRPRPARSRWSRRNPCSRIGVRLQQRRAASVEVDRVGVGAEPVERLLGLGVAGDDPHAGLALGAGLGQQQRPAVVEHPAGHAAAGLGRLLLVGLQPAALHEVHDERGRRRSRAAGTCPGGRRRRARGRPPTRAAGTHVFSAVNVMRPEPRERRAGEVARRAARRGPGPRAARASASELGAGPHGRRTRRRRRRTRRWCGHRAAPTSPPTRSSPTMNADCADSSPRPIAAAVVVGLA